MRIGILSTAHPHAHGYRAALAGMPDVEVRVAETAAELVDGFAPDGVIVCSENAHHRRDVEAAAAAGAHVLCEKPLATTVADAEAMIEACARAGVALMVAHPVRWSSAFSALADSIGSLGELLAITGTNNGRLPAEQPWFTDPDLAGGGALVDHTVHVADLVDALTDGAEPVSVYAVSNRNLHPDLPVETAGLVSIEYATGLVLTVDCSWSRPADYPTWGGLTMDLLGTDGLASMDAFTTRADGHLGGRTAWAAYGVDPDAGLVAHFLAVVAGEAAPAPDGAAGLRGVRIVTAALESARTGAAVTP